MKCEKIHIWCNIACLVTLDLDSKYGLQIVGNTGNVMQMVQLVYRLLRNILITNKVTEICDHFCVIIAYGLNS